MPFIHASDRVLCQEFRTPCHNLGVRLCVKGSHSWPLRWHDVECPHPSCKATYSVELDNWKEGAVQQFLVRDRPDLEGARDGVPFWWIPA